MINHEDVTLLRKLHRPLASRDLDRARGYATCRRRTCGQRATAPRMPARAKKIVDQTEDRSVQPNPECHCDDSNRRERRRFTQLAQSKLYIIHSIRGAITRTAGPSVDRCVRRRGLEGSRP
jgi:hypothetical protein